MDKDKIQDTIKRCSYLLGQTDLFKHFVDMKLEIPSTLRCWTLSPNRRKRAQKGGQQQRPSPKVGERRG